MLNNSIIYIDGTVGVGKTTLLNIMKEEGFFIVPEPHLENPILEKYYENKERYSFSSQVYFLNKKYELIHKHASKSNCVIDRSIYGDFIFAKMLYDTGIMIEEEFHIYSDLFDNMIKYLPSPKLIINLSISNDEVLKRIKKRGREYEQNVDISYWSKLNKYYNSFINNCKYPLLNIDVNNIDFENNINDRKNVLNMINTSLKISNYSID